MSLFFKPLSQHFTCFSRIVVCPYCHIVSRRFTSRSKSHKFTDTLSKLSLRAHMNYESHKAQEIPYMFHNNYLLIKQFNLVGTLTKYCN